MSMVLFGDDNGQSSTCLCSCVCVTCFYVNSCDRI